MTVPDSWVRAAWPLEAHPGVLEHRRGATLAPPTPAQRQVELQQELNRVRGILGEAIGEVRRLERDYDRYHSFSGTSFAGVTMAQIWADLVLWEAILNDNPQLRGIVEIGTWQGGFSFWLHAQASARRMNFVTCDAIVPEGPPVPGFERVDVFAHPEWVEMVCAGFAPVALFCDGGNKPRELRTFGPMVGPAGIVVVHDWGTEMLPSDVPGGLEEVYGGFCDDLGSVSRVFKVKP